MVDSLKTYAPAAHRCELVAEVDGVKFINDSKATNLDAVHKAVLSVPQGLDGHPNIWLIAGGKDKGLEFHDIGPLLSKRVKGAFLIGETRHKIQAAWGLFTPCSAMDSLQSAVAEAAHQAVPGDVVMLSPACSSFDQFQNYVHRGEVFRQAVHDWQISRLAPSGAAKTLFTGDSAPTQPLNVNASSVGTSERTRAITEARI
jgi:UDP-N-acetylmuramoylalanine--D-glutamate ligase